MRFLQHDQIIGLKQPPKTQWRGLIKPNERCLDGLTIATCWAHEHIGYLTDHRVWTPYYIKWQVGRTYAVQRPDGKTVGRTPPVRAIRQERLGDISLEDVFAEGVAYQIPPSEEWLVIPDLDVARLLYAEVWERCGGNWERDRDKSVWVLDWGKED